MLGFRGHQKIPYLAKLKDKLWAHGCGLWLNPFIQALPTGQWLRYKCDYSSSRSLGDMVADFGEEMVRVGKEHTQDWILC